MRDIFISYVEEDSQITTKLAEQLEAAGYSVWYYERDGIPGDSYLLQTRWAIEGCQALVLIISPRSVASDQVTLEVVRAHESNKKFFPLRTDISHADFVERRPEWAQALGAATSTAVTLDNIASVVPRILLGMKKMNLLPRPELVTKDSFAIPPELQARAQASTATTSPPKAPLTNIVAPSTPVIVAKGFSFGRLFANKHLLAVAGLAAALLVVIAIYMWKKPTSAVNEAALTRTAFRDEFINLNAWEHPHNWVVSDDSLEIAGEQQLGSLKDKNYRNFTMSFQVVLLNGEGAAWALRVNKKGYYLFYLSGPKGLQPNRFMTYLVKDNKTEPVGSPRNTARPLLEGGIYTITIKTVDNHIFHEIRIDSAPDGQFESEEFKLGDYFDSKDTFPAGSVGFRAFATERFSVSELFVLPPGTQP